MIGTVKSLGVMAAIAALGAMGVSPPVPDRRREHEPDPPKIKTAGNKAGSKYRNRRKRGKPLFHV